MTNTDSYQARDSQALPLGQQRPCTLPHWDASTRTPGSQGQPFGHGQVTSFLPCFYINEITLEVTNVYHVFSGYFPIEKHRAKIQLLMVIVIVVSIIMSTYFAISTIMIILHVLTQLLLKGTKILPPPNYAFWDFDFKLVIKKEKTLKELLTVPLFCLRFKIERPAPGRES